MLSVRVVYADGSITGRLEFMGFLLYVFRKTSFIKMSLDRTNIGTDRSMGSNLFTVQNLTKTVKNERPRSRR
jgi:hypothetical protein